MTKEQLKEKEVTKKNDIRPETVILIPEETTPYDDVYRTMLEKCRKLIIPVINECFGTDYGMNEEVVLLSNEHYYVEDNKIRKRITDSCIKISNHLYHLECQSTNDTLMELRMMEYDFHIALAHCDASATEKVLRFPESAVMYLRGTDNIPNKLSVKIVFPNENKVEYQIPTIKVQEYSKKEILDKNLLFFIPYYILRFEKELDNIEAQEERMQEVLGDYQDIYNYLKKLGAEKYINSQYLHYLLLLTNKLVDVVAGDAQNLRRKVSIMGGKVLELETDRIIAENRAIGKAQSILELLSYRDMVPQSIENMILQEENPDKLKKWLKLAADVGSVDEFIAKM